MPSDCTLVNTFLDCSVIVDAGVPIEMGVFYGFDGYLIPINDPDGGIDIEVLWDTQVPKMDQDLSYELSDASDTAPRYEPGQELTESILGISFSSPEQVFKRRRMMTYATHPMGFDFATLNYTPADHFSSRIGKKYRAIMESALLFAVSNPGMDDDVQNLELLPTGADEEWVMMKYINRILDDMMVHVLGLGTVGSGTVPWSTAETFIENLVSDFGTIDDGPFSSSPAALNCFVKATAQVVVPGDLPRSTISAE